MAESASVARKTKTSRIDARHSVNYTMGKAGPLSPISNTTCRIMGLDRPVPSIRTNTVFTHQTPTTPSTAYRPLHMVPQSSALKTPRSPIRDTSRYRKTREARGPMGMLSIKGKEAKRAPREIKDDRLNLGIPPLSFRSTVLKTPEQSFVAADHSSVAEPRMRLKMKAPEKTDQERKLRHRAIPKNETSTAVTQEKDHWSDIQQADGHPETDLDNQEQAQLPSMQRRKPPNLRLKSVASSATMAVNLHGSNDQAAVRETLRTVALIQVNHPKYDTGSAQAHLSEQQSSNREGAICKPPRLPKNVTYRSSSAVLDNPHILLGLLGQSGKLMWAIRSPQLMNGSYCSFFTRTSSAGTSISTSPSPQAGAHRNDFESWISLSLSECSTAATASQ